MQPLRMLISGAAGCGKSTLCAKAKDRLQERIELAIPDAFLCGVLSREVHDAKGFKIGYDMHSLDGSSSEKIARLDGPETHVMVARYHVYTDGIERVTVPALDQLLQASGRPRIAIIDDVGNMTSKCEAFCRRVRKLLESPDPQMHVLAAVGQGGADFIAEVRRISGVTCIRIDDANRDDVLDSLTSRFLAALLWNPNDSSDDDDSSGRENIDSSHLKEFDQWGGDRRQLGVRRGMYNPQVSPCTILAVPDQRQDLEQHLPSVPSTLRGCTLESSSAKEDNKVAAEGIFYQERGENSKCWEKNAHSGWDWKNSSGDSSQEQRQNQNRLDILEWLENIYPFFLVAAYGKALQTRFGVAQDVIDAYAQKDRTRASQAVSEKFFEDFGVRKLGHKRLFEKWFREQGCV